MLGMDFESYYTFINNWIFDNGLDFRRMLRKSHLLTRQNLKLNKEIRFIEFILHNQIKGKCSGGKKRAKAESSWYTWIPKGCIQHFIAIPDHRNQLFYGKDIYSNLLQKKEHWLYKMLAGFHSYSLDDILFI